MSRPEFSPFWHFWPCDEGMLPIPGLGSVAAAWQPHVVSHNESVTYVDEWASCHRLGGVLWPSIFPWKGGVDFGVTNLVGGRLVLV
jgi:hypothetical protein